VLIIAGIALLEFDGKEALTRRGREHPWVRWATGSTWRLPGTVETVMESSTLRGADRISPSPSIPLGAPRKASNRRLTLADRPADRPAKCLECRGAHQTSWRDP
jgi:hypothetical protein